VTEFSDIKVALLMGSRSDWDVLSACSEMLSDFDVPHECRVLSAHRTPEALVEFIKDAEVRGCKVFIGAAGGAAHLAGVIASKTLKPVLGIPMTSALDGLDSLLSTVQMPGGIPVGTLGIGKAGAQNAALLAIAILGTTEPEYLDQIKAYRQKRADTILAEELPPVRKSAGFKK